MHMVAEARVLEGTTRRRNARRYGVEDYTGPAWALGTMVLSEEWVTSHYAIILAAGGRDERSEEVDRRVLDVDTSTPLA